MGVKANNQHKETTVKIKTIAIYTLISTGMSTSLAAGVAVNGTGVTFPDGSIQTTAAYDASTCIPIKQADIPLIINQPGHYCLTEHIVSADRAITITADDVTLNLNGHAIDGSANTADTTQDGITCNSSDNLTITNGSIYGYAIGIDLISGCKGTEISNMHIHHNYQYGIKNVSSSHNLTILNNRINNIGSSTNSTNAYGIYALYTMGLIISGNTIDSITASGTASAWGIQSVAALGGQILGNHISNLNVDTGDAYPIEAISGVNLLIKDNNISGPGGTTAIRGGNTATILCVGNITFGYSTTISDCTDGGGNYP